MRAWYDSAELRAIKMYSTAITQFAQSCSPGLDVSLGIPTWYEGLSCGEGGAPNPTELNDLWVIGTNIIDILLFVAGVAAVFFIIYGGIKLITSQGQPDKIVGARQTLIYAAAGLIISIIARVAVQYAAQQVFQTTEVQVDV